MKKINCNIIRDVLPLYADGVVSDETKEMIDNHIKTCAACRAELTAMKKDFTIPDSEKVQMAQANSLKKIKKKQKIRVISAVIVTALLMVILWMIVTNVGSVNQRFYENSSYMVTMVDNDSGWIEAADFSSNALFFKGKIANHANSAGSVHLRIRNTAGNVIIDECIIKAGTAIDADLKRSEEYIIEIKGDAGQYIITVY